MLIEQEPCTACSWTSTRQDSCGYQSNVKIFYAIGDRAAWEVGSQRIIKDRPCQPPNSEAENLRYIQEKSTIPVPVVVDDWTERDRHFIITTRLPGTPLSEIWPNLLESEKDNYAKQTADYLRQLRALCSARIQGINEQPVYCACLFRVGYGIPHGPINSDEELWDEMAQGLRNVPQDLQDHLRRRMPAAQPYTFTHGDLTAKNIIVQNGRVTGIIDWEGSGYFPVWWEFVSTAIFDDEVDRSWKDHLRGYMKPYTKELLFWRCYYNLSRGSDLSIELLKWLQVPEENIN